MKNSIKLLSLLAVFAVTFASCGKDDSADPDDNNNNTTKEFAVTVDGTVWANITTTAFINQSNRMIIEAKKGEESVVIIIPGDIAVGTYAMGAPFQNNVYNGTYKESELGNSYGSTSGTLKITAHDKTAKTIAGTFSFSASPTSGSGTKSVTAGSFDVTYTVQ